MLGIEEEDDQPQLTVNARSATTLVLSWPVMGGATEYTVDYFSTYTTCDFPPMHNDVFRVMGTSVTLTGLTPATLYQIHVHELPARSQSTNVILVSTLAAGSATQTVTPTDYNTCKTTR